MLVVSNLYLQQEHLLFVRPGGIGDMTILKMCSGFSMKTQIIFLPMWKLAVVQAIFQSVL